MHNNYAHSLTYDFHTNQTTPPFSSLVYSCCLMPHQHYCIVRIIIFLALYLVIMHLHLYCCDFMSCEIGDKLTA